MGWWHRWRHGRLTALLQEATVYHLAAQELKCLHDSDLATLGLDRARLRGKVAYHEAKLVLRGAE